MTFQICRDQEDGPSAWGGVLEFTAEEGTVALPLKILRKLDLDSQINDNETMVTLHIASLPKGEFVQLEPLDPPRFNEIPAPQAHLQASLGMYNTTLSVGDTFPVQYGASAPHFVRVTELKPNEAVSLIDTELEVDLHIPSFVQSDQPSGDSLPTPLELEKDLACSLPTGKWKYVKLVIPEQIMDSVVDGSQCIVVSYSVQNFELDGSDCEVFVRLHETPTLLDHHMKFPLSRGSATGTLSHDSIPTAKRDTPVFFGFRADDAVASLADAQINVTFQVKPREESLTPPQQHEPVDSPKPEQSSDPVCSNCGRSIPAHNMAMHETFCLRNNIRCPVEGCHQVILRNQQDKHCHCSQCKRVFSSQDLPQHETNFHTSYSCLMCSGSWSGGLEELRQHQRGDCPQRLIRCRFCEDIVPSGGDPDDWRDKFHWGLSQHESICGSKTIVCDECHQNVRIKEMDFHMRAHEEAKRTPVKPPSSGVANLQPPTAPTEEANVDDVTMTENEVVECPICSVQLPSLRHLNSHLDTQHYT